MVDCCGGRASVVRPFGVLRDDYGEGAQDMGDGGVVAGVEDWVAQEDRAVAFVVGAVPSAPGGGDFVSGGDHAGLGGFGDQLGQLREAAGGNFDVAVADAGGADADIVAVNDFKC